MRQACVGVKIPAMQCRFCRTPVQNLFVSLGAAPMTNAFLTKEQLGKMEPNYPLEVYVCANCFLVQLDAYETPEVIFSNYAYFSSYSDTWLRHVEDYTRSMISRMNLNKNSFVVEIASNDGYLLQYFIQEGIPVLGIEPAHNIAEAARQKGVPTKSVFFGYQTALELANNSGQADLLLGNNVLAHVPDLNDFVDGLKILLKPHGVITMEFPHLMQLIEGMQFDTIYHEHFSYFSFFVVEQVFASHGLTIYDVIELPTHGGSLRIYAKHQNDDTTLVSSRVHSLKEHEKAAGYLNLEFYDAFDKKVRKTKRGILKFLINAKNHDKKIAGYGAPAKGNTLLNYCGVRTDFIDYTVDRNPFKQGRFMPGSRIPIKPLEYIRETKPDYLFILPWNIKEEIIAQMSYIREWHGQFVIPIPQVTVL